MKFGDGATLEVMHEAYGDAKFCFVPRGEDWMSFHRLDPVGATWKMVKYILYKQKTLRA